MRYVSVFSGIEAASVAWGPLGWHPVCFCEVDEFPKAVLRHRFPSVPNLGDITKVDWRSLAKCAGRPDAVVGGSPCQSFSVAGARTGLEGESGLMWEYVRCVRELMPRWLLWENVPGALSSSNGEDFRCLLESLDALGYGLAWRVLDAQFFGVAQRRERVFVVGYLGDPAPPAEVLFEPESLRWDTPTSREKRKELAARAGGGAEAAGFKYHQGSGAGNIGYEPEQSPTLTADYHNPAVFISGDHKASESEGVAGTLPASTGGFKPGAVMCIPENAINRPTGGTNGPMCYGPGEPSPTLRASRDVSAVMCMTETQPHSMVDGEVCGALSATMHKDPPVAGFAQNTRDEVRLQGGDGSVSGALSASPGMKQTTYVAQGYTVRRLTPRECERLQGFPDDWTKVPYKGKPEDECPDTPRYKAIGNSMAVPVMRWIGERMQKAEEACRST